MRQEQFGHLTVEKHVSLPIGQSHLYILLDGARVDAGKLAYSHDDGPLLEPLYRGTRHSAALEVSPCLVQPSSASRLWDSEPEWCDYGIVIESDADLYELAEHLRSLLSMRLPSRQLAYCRFYAPSWLARFMSSTTAEELTALSGPIQRWFAHDMDGWLSLGAPSIGPSRTAGEEGWFCLRQEQLDHLQGEEQHAFIERMAVHFDCPAGNTSVGLTARQRIDGLIGRTRKLGFSKEYQCIHYLELAWRFPDEIEQPELEQLLSDSSIAPDQRLAQAECLLFGLA